MSCDHVTRGTPNRCAKAHTHIHTLGVGRITPGSTCVCVCVQDWAYDEEGQLVLAGLLCLDVSEIRTFDPPRLMKCHGSGGSQQWSLGVRHTH